MTHVSKLVRETRIARGLTQHDLADALGFNNAQYISNIERGVCSLSIAHARPLARLLKISINAIIDAKTEDQRQIFIQAVKDGGEKKRVSGL